MDIPKPFLKDHDEDDSGPESFFSAILKSETELLADILSSNKKLKRIFGQKAAHLGGSLWVARRCFVPYDFPSDYDRVEEYVDHMHKNSREGWPDHLDRIDVTAGLHFYKQCLKYYFDKTTNSDEQGARNKHRMITIVCQSLQTSCGYTNSPSSYTPYQVLSSGLGSGLDGVWLDRERYDRDIRARMAYDAGFTRVDVPLVQWSTTNQATQCNIQPPPPVCWVPTTGQEPTNYVPICTVEEANALIESSLSSTVDAQQRKPRPLNTHTRFGDERAEWAEGDTVLGDAGRNPSSSSTAADKTFELSLIHI